MAKRLNRRKFLQAGLAASVAFGSGVMTGRLTDEVTSGRVDSDNDEAVRAAMDELIPAGNGMPAASEVGVLEYLRALSDHDPDFRKKLDQSLAYLDAICQSQFHKNFLQLSRHRRMLALQHMEKLHSANFSLLRDYTYEGYYTQPKVWNLMEYEFTPTNGAAPHMKPFDESILDKVRKKPKHYREVD